MKRTMELSAARWLINRLSAAAMAWFAKAGAGRRPDSREQRVRFEDLSPHILRDLGFSPQDARDMAAQERAHFLN